MCIMVFSATRKALLMTFLKFRQILAVVIAMLPSAAYGVTIDVSSQSFSITGSELTANGLVPVSLSGSDPQSISRSDFPNFGGVIAEAGGTVSSESVFLHVLKTSAVWGESLAGVTWRPGENGLANLDVATFTTSPCCAASYVTLEDLTTGATLLHQGPVWHYPDNPIPSFDGSGTFQFAVDPSHTYLLSANALGTTDWSGANVTLTVLPVPDTTSVTMLLGISLSSLAGLRCFARFC